MIAYVMLYTVAVGVPILLATWAVAAVLRRYGRPERLVWLGGLALSFGLPVFGLLGGLTAGSVTATGQGSAGAATGVIGLPEIFVITDGTAGTQVADVAVALWIGASLLLMLQLIVAALRLARAGRAWERAVMDGVPVWLTERMGPAVSGLMRPRVLVPRWLADMPVQRRSLVLLHEQEHIRALDPWLMLVCRVAPILTPWHPVVWLLSARLLRAIELDCDRRVLEHRPDVRTYGHTLLEISARDSGRLVAAAAFAESEAPLRSRILNMTTPSRTVSRVALTTATALGVVLLAAACEIPVPTTESEVGSEVDQGNGSVSATPTAADQALADSVGRRRVEEPVDAAETIEQVRRERAIPVERLDADARERLRLEAQGGFDTDPDSPGSDLLDGPTFTPFTVAPTLVNMTEVQQALVREYPTRLRDAGIGGRVLLWFFIDEGGLVRRTLINQSSGQPELDQAALNVANVYRFSPAMNRENAVPVWVALPLTFAVR